jgi:GNAT superfamily N-acetyltransferase
MRIIEIITESTNPAEAWVKKVYDMYPDWPYGQADKVMVWGEGPDQQFAAFKLKPLAHRDRPTVELSWIMAGPEQRQGVGSRAIKELQRIASLDGIRLTLFPWAHGQVSQPKLMKLYKRHGFKPQNKGSKHMQWEPEITTESQNFTTAYHITTQENADNILHGGLDPREEGKAYLVVDEGNPARLRDDLRTVAGWLLERDNDDPLTLLKINVAGVPLEFEHGWYFSTVAIPPDRIQDLGERAFIGVS